ncbi:MAG TPA: hypothetical protein VIH73_07820 [Acidimicrobiales bacterium]
MTLIVAVMPLALSTTTVTAASTPSTCHAPRLTGLTVTVARRHAKAAGCDVRLVGAKLQMPQIQTVRTQDVRPGKVTKVVTLTINPLCSGAAENGPPAGEPIITTGPTELISGLFLEGGPFMIRSAPNCKDVVEKSSPGWITVTNSAGTVIVNKMELKQGQLLYVKVPAGKYTITGVLAVNNKVGPITVDVPAGKTVRQDLTFDAP